jgi:hypothetical protein
MTIEIKSVPKHSKAGKRPNTQSWNLDERRVDEARRIINDAHIKHRKESEWYEIWINGRIEFDSAYIHHSKIVRK